MAFHIEHVQSNVTAIDGDMPLTAAQIEKLVALVARRIEEKGREKAMTQEASSIQRHVAPPLRIGD